RSVGALNLAAVASVLRRRPSGLRLVEADALTKLREGTAQADAGQPLAEMSGDRHPGQSAHLHGPEQETVANRDHKSRTDEDMLTMLGRSLAGGYPDLFNDLISNEGRPPGQMVIAVRQRAIDSSIDQGRKTNGRRRKHNFLVLLVMGSIMGSTLFTGMVLGSTLPGPVRTFAHFLRLPVESASLKQSQLELARLAAALDRGDLSAVHRADSRLSRLMGDLDPAERRSVDAIFHQLHHGH
ncbi:MAG: hypothetical protein ACRDRT_15030, partial [Pseudonocardiaceae bacterium]